MTWAFRRQALYVTIIVLFFLGLGFIIGYPYIHKAPTCSDYKQNGDETGVDCGGSCVRACTFEVDKLSVLWSRAFRVTEGRYNAVAYVENQNRDTGVYRVTYRFRFADKDNVYIGMREGETFVPPAAKFAIFEPAINVGYSEPVYTTFEFTQTPVWVTVPKEKLGSIKFTISDIVLADEDSSPRLTTQFKNNSLWNIPELSVIAILYDEAGNAINVSKTYRDLFRAEESAELVFTWPEPFSKKVFIKEIIPMYNVFTARLQ